MGAKLVLIALAAAAGGGVAAIELTSTHVGHPLASALLALLVGWSFIGSGIAAWPQRKENHLGPVMVFIGFSWFLTFLADIRRPLPFTVGTALEDLYLIGFVYLALSFPTGTLVSRTNRALFAAAVFLAGFVELAWLMLAPSNRVICSAGCPHNLLEVAARPSAANAILDGQRAGGLIFSVVTVGVLLRRWQLASPPRRRTTAPLLWVGAAMFAALSLSIVSDATGSPIGTAPSWIRSIVFAAVPVSVLAVLFQRRLAKGAVANLVVELGAARPDEDLRDALARALGDATLQVVFWVPNRGEYVDSRGRVVELPGKDDERTYTVVRQNGDIVASLIHDRALSENAELIDSVCAAAALSLENERLHAELRARLDDLAASRARLVQASEGERRRLERDLHDGAQQRLVSIAMTLGLLESRISQTAPGEQPLLGEARVELAAALNELRDLSQGIRPSVLTERGLGPALKELCHRAAVPIRAEILLDSRLSPDIEDCAYFVVSEALANIAKHSHASEGFLSAAREDGKLVLEIADNGVGGATLAPDRGLRGLLDRVETLGGRLLLLSEPGDGTAIRVEIPCASS